MTTCPSCSNGKLKKGRVEERMFGVSLGTYTAEVCPACRESFLDESAMRKLEARAKELGVWGLGRKLKLSRSGNSIVLRIPADVAKFRHLTAGKEVYLHPEGEDRFVVDIEG